MTPKASALRFTVTGSPRTKKTSNRIVRFGKDKEFIKVLPSESYEAWFAAAMTQALAICAQLRLEGHVLPISAPVNCRALFYRDQLTGDAVGYYNALADWLQEPLYKGWNALTGKYTVAPDPSTFSHPIKQYRKGAGIIRDDSQVVSWDGSRLLKNAGCPRIDVELTEVGPVPEALDLQEKW